SSNAMGGGQGQVSAESAEAGVHRTEGAQGRAVVETGGSAVVETRLGQETGDPKAGAEASAHWGVIGARDDAQDLRDHTAQESGYKNPEGEVGRAETKESHLAGRAYTAGNVAETKTN